MKNTNNLKISARDSQTYGNVAVPLSTATQRQLRNCLIHFCLLLSFSLVLFSFSFRSAAAQSSRRSPNPYTLQLGDCIDVTVEGYPEYSKPISACLDGFISYPPIEKIQVEDPRLAGVEDSRLAGADIPLRLNEVVFVLNLLYSTRIELRLSPCILHLESCMVRRCKIQDSGCKSLIGYHPQYTTTPDYVPGTLIEMVLGITDSIRMVKAGHFRCQWLSLKSSSALMRREEKK